jgi:hypothetical protein
MAMTTCAAHHTGNPPRALSGLRLCAGHHADLTEALTGPSAADDPTLDAEWGVRDPRRGVTIYQTRDAAACAWALAKAVYLADIDITTAPDAIVAPPSLVCGDGQTWHDPRNYRPARIARDYRTLSGLTGWRTGDTVPHVSGTAEPALPFNDRIAQLRSDIPAVLASWCSTHARDLKIAAPADGRVPTLAAYLARYIDWSSAQDFAGDYCDEVTGLRHRARTLADLPRRAPQTVGPCGRYGCGGTLRFGGADIACDACGDRTAPGEWARLADRMEAHAERPA